jgi:patatin-like phospholipase/acyl hydrolase
VDDSIAVQSYLDGGIWANNPILPAIAEAVRQKSPGTTYTLSC